MGLLNQLRRIFVCKSDFIVLDLWWLTSVLANLGKLGISGAFGIVYVMSAEISPTVVRTIGVGSGSMCACMGGLVAPFIGELVSCVSFV